MSRPRKSRYTKLEGTFWRNEKVRARPLEAIGLHACALAYCSDQMTDGRIPKHMVAALAGGRNVARFVAALLADRPLWYDRGDHYEIHDYLAHNISKAQDDSRLSGDSDRKRTGMDAESAPETTPETPAISGAFPRAPLTHDSGLMTHDSGDRARTSPVDFVDACYLVRDRFAAARAGIGASWTPTRKDADRIEQAGDRVRDIAAQNATTCAAVVDRALAAFLADLKSKREGYPFAFFAPDVGRWYAAAATPRGPAKAAPHEAFAGAPSVEEQMAGWGKP